MRCRYCNALLDDSEVSCSRCSHPLYDVCEGFTIKEDFREDLITKKLYVVIPQEYGNLTNSEEYKCLASCQDTSNVYSILGSCYKNSELFYSDFVEKDKSSLSKALSIGYSKIKDFDTGVFPREKLNTIDFVNFTFSDLSKSYIEAIKILKDCFLRNLSTGNFDTYTNTLIKEDNEKEIKKLLFYIGILIVISSSIS